MNLNVLITVRWYCERSAERKQWVPNTHWSERCFVSSIIKWKYLNNYGELFANIKGIMLNKCNINLFLYYYNTWILLYSCGPIFIPEHISYWAGPLLYSFHLQPLSALLSQAENIHFEETFACFGLKYGCCAAFIHRPLTRLIRFWGMDDKTQAPTQLRISAESAAWHSGGNKKEIPLIFHFVTRNRPAEVCTFRWRDRLWILNVFLRWPWSLKLRWILHAMITERDSYLMPSVDLFW